MKKGYKKLFVWERADEFAYEVYLKTKSFPKDERFGITSQLRRAVLSIPTNIVEGSGRQHQKEMKQFLNIALGSHAEAEYLLDFSKRLGYLKEEEYQYLDELRNKLGGLLWQFYKSFL